MRNSFFEKFNSEFEKHLPSTKNYRAAFHAASEVFVEKVGVSPYSNFETFKTRRTQVRGKRDK
jgi:hypothetical protein